MISNISSLIKQDSIQDDKLYIAVSTAYLDIDVPCVLLLCEDFSHYVQVLKQDYAHDITKVRFGDVLRCFGDDNGQIDSLDESCGDTFKARTNFFKFFDTGLTELIDQPPSDRERQYQLRQGLYVLADCIARNANAFEPVNSEVYSYEQYISQVRRLQFFADKLHNPTKPSLVSFYADKLRKITDHMDSIFANARHYHDWADCLPSRVARPIQTTIDDFDYIPVPSK